MSPAVPDPAGLAAAVLAGDRTQLSRAITLVESARPDHRRLAGEMLLQLLPAAGRAVRVGITGVPGVGKSTFIEALGTRLITAGHRVAVLAVDPSSTRTGGSILGDKTRMGTLATAEGAFIRPSPTSGTLGGVARATRETMVLVEAAGYDVVLVETVGVGQSEVTVHGMVDTFCLLTLARTGDSLQGIKKGVLELADIIAVNKADGEFAGAAERAAGEMRGAIRLLYPHHAPWIPPVLTLSGQTGLGVDRLWEEVLLHRETLTATGVFASRRASQQVDWAWQLVREELQGRLTANPQVSAQRQQVEARLRAGSITAAMAAAELLTAFDGSVS